MSDVSDINDKMETWEKKLNYMRQWRLDHPENMAKYAANKKTRRAEVTFKKAVEKAYRLLETVKADLETIKADKVPGKPDEPSGNAG